MAGLLTGGNRAAPAQTGLGSAPAAPPVTVQQAQDMTNPANAGIVNAQASGAHNMAAGAMNMAGQAYTALGQTPRIAESMNAYLNPYYQEVIQGALGNMYDAHQQNLNAIGSDALMGGAFGGSRHGLVERGAIRDYNRDVGQFTNEMLMQRFNTAAQLGNQDIGNWQSGVSQAAAGLRGLGGDYYNIGNNIIDRNAQMGAGQRQINQQVLDLAALDFDRYTQSPYAALDIMQIALGRDPRQGNYDSSTRGVAKTEGTYRPGALTMAGDIISSLPFGG